MEERAVNQYGRNIYIEKDEGNIYVGDNYVEDPSSAFCNGSYELLDYTPTIDPPILREEVGQILEWIERKAPVENAARIALLYGKAGIGKSIVMHDLLENPVGVKHPIGMMQEGRGADYKNIADPSSF